MSPGHTILKLLWQLSWLGPKFRKAIFKRLARRGDTPDVPFSKDFFGLRYEGNLNNSIEFYIYYYDAFEKPLLFFLGDTLLNIRNDKARLRDDRSCFCDVGSNIGQHSLFMSNLADRVHAFEPFPAVSQKLEQHIELNQIQNISLHKLALSDRTEQLNFYAPTGRNQGIGSFDASTIAKGNTDAGKFSLVRGDEFFRQHQIDGVDLLKIDVEGFEKKVLNGLQQTLSAQRPIVVCEVSYGIELSFGSFDDLVGAFPRDYELFGFNTRKADGRKARRRGEKARKSGAYQLIPLSSGSWRGSGQDDIVACPVERREILPMLGIGKIPAP
jgi:FkbM family methyltransferase